MYSKLLYVFVFVVFVLLGCETANETLKWDKYSVWLKRKEHGIYKEKEINNIKISVEYLPIDYLAYEEIMKNNLEKSKLVFDSLKKGYGNSNTFLIKVESTKSFSKASSLIYYGLASEEGYKERVHILNFKMDNYIMMKSKGKEYSPVLISFDGQNELANEVKFIAVFTNEVDKGDMEITFDDPFWGLGTNHFVFDKNAVLSIPKLDVD